MTNIASHTRRARKPSQDRNTALPQYLTSLFMQGLSRLSDESFRNQYLLEEVFSKYLDGASDTAGNKSRAIAKWLEIEKQNEATNDRLSYIPPVTLGGIRLSSLVKSVRKTVSCILGDTVPLDCLIGNFSGGASTSRNRLQSLPAMKYTGRADITSAALPWFKLLVGDNVSPSGDVTCELPGWSPFTLDLNVVEGNRLFTVPKKSDIDRVCCKEPDLNMWLQKGVGLYIRKRLRKWGIDLNDQSRNKNLARQGSINGDLATLDLSSASDSMSCGVVEMFLPDQWFNLLHDLRSPVTMIGDDKHTNEMFSSMGNGFTFELESLIFFAIVKSVHLCLKASGPISIYGDDIICPSSIANTVVEALQWFGFNINLKKSFSAGPFRESCGGHYYNGLDVSPFYLRGPLKRLTDLINILNKMRKWSDTGGHLLDPDLENLWFELAEFVPADLRGGFDYDCDTVLVSHDLPRKRLVRMNEDIDVPDEGSYVMWLNTTWDRSPGKDAYFFNEVYNGCALLRKDPHSPADMPLDFTIEVSKPSRALTKCRARRLGTSWEGGLVRRIPAFAGEL